MEGGDQSGMIVCAFSSPLLELTVVADMDMYSKRGMLNILWQLPCPAVSPCESESIT